jgi:hypothetical protein
VAYLIAIFFCGLSAGIIGRLKGSSFWIWFGVGLVLPVIGSIAAALYRNERAEPRRACPECGKVQPLYVQVCTRCGRDLDWPDEVIPAR